jgi:hypothetical protein
MKNKEVKVLIGRIFCVLFGLFNLWGVIFAWRGRPLSDSFINFCLFALCLFAFIKTYKKNK